MGGWVGGTTGIKASEWYKGEKEGTKRGRIKTRGKREEDGRHRGMHTTDNIGIVGQDIRTGW